MQSGCVPFHGEPCVAHFHWYLLYGAAGRGHELALGALGHIMVSLNVLVAVRLWRAWVMEASQPFPGSLGSAVLGYSLATLGTQHGAQQYQTIASALRGLL